THPFDQHRPDLHRCSDRPVDQVHCGSVTPTTRVLATKNRFDVATQVIEDRLVLGVHLNPVLAGVLRKSGPELDVFGVVVAGSDDHNVRLDLLIEACRHCPQVDGATHRRVDRVEPTEVTETTA